MTSYIKFEKGGPEFWENLCPSCGASGPPKGNHAVALGGYACGSHVNGQAEFMQTAECAEGTERFQKEFRRLLSKPLLIGEAANPPNTEPFMGRSGLFLANLVHLSLNDFRDLVECRNLLDAWPGRSGSPKGHRFPLKKAQAAAKAMQVEGRTVILAGKRVALAFGLKNPNWLEDVVLNKGEHACFVIPHPSGVVRWYNQVANCDAVKQLLLDVLKEAARCADCTAP